MALNGLRPVSEIQFADFIYPGFDQIVSELARLRYRSGGDFFSPMTIRTPCGGGIRGGQTHSQSPEGIFTHISGVKTVMVSNPYDPKGLLISAIESDDPVVFFEPKRIYNGPFDGDPDKPAVSWAAHPKGEVPDDYYTVPLDKAEIVEAGEDLTIITYGTMAAKAVVRDVGRVLGHPYGFVDRIAKLIPFEIGMTLDKALEQEEALKERSAKLLAEIKAYNDRIRDLGLEMVDVTTCHER